MDTQHTDSVFLTAALQRAAEELRFCPVEDCPQPLAAKNTVAVLDFSGKGGGEEAVYLCSTCWDRHLLEDPRILRDPQIYVVDGRAQTKVRSLKLSPVARGFLTALSKLPNGETTLYPNQLSGPLQGFRKELRGLSRAGIVALLRKDRNISDPNRRETVGLTHEGYIFLGSDPQTRFLTK